MRGGTIGMIKRGHVRFIRSANLIDLGIAFQENECWPSMHRTVMSVMHRPRQYSYSHGGYFVLCGNVGDGIDITLQEINVGVFRG